MRKLVLFLIVAVILAGCATQGTEEIVIKLPPREKEFSEIVLEAKEKVFPALVYVKPIQEEYSWGKKEKVQVFGSGVIISPDGYVVTNHHVAEKTVSIKCVLSNKEEVGASVVGIDKATDIAVLRLHIHELKEGKRLLKEMGKLKEVEARFKAAKEAKSSDPDKKEKKIEKEEVEIPDIAGLALPFAVFGDSGALKDGDYVMAMGAPFGFSRSVSLGIVSCRRRYLQYEANPYTLWIQTDAAINPGNSGGPLINLKGEIVGINTLGMAGWADNIGFAIPSDLVKDVVKRLMKEKKIVRSWTGIRFQALKDFTKSVLLEADEGVLVASVDENSPAKESGIRAGDIILKCGEKKTDGIYNEDIPGVRKFFSDLPLNKPLTLDVRRRKGKEQKEEMLTVGITPIVKPKPEGADFECKGWDMTVKEISKFDNPSFHFYRKKGIFIQGVKSPGNANTSGFSSGVIIATIDGKEITALKELKEVYERLIKKPKGERTVFFELIRDGHYRCLVLDYEKDWEKIEEEEE